MQTNLLTMQEKESIRQEMIQIFGEEGSKSLLFDFNAFKTSIDATITEMNLQTYSYTSFWSGAPITVIRRKMSQEIQRKNYLAMKGFLLIFKFREFLFNTKLDYRYYYTDINGNTGLKTFDDMDLLDFTIFSDHGIKLNTEAIKAKAQEGNEFFKNKMNQYINVYTNPDKNKYMQKVKPEVQNLRMVRKNIMRRYGSLNSGLKTVDGTKYQTFNMGHIYESLDITLVSAFQDYGEEQMDSYIDNYMFGRYLKRDNVIASKGGDNFLTNTSIKSNQANLYSFNTIVNQLYAVQQMLSITNRQQLCSEITRLFIDTSDKSKELYDLLEKNAWDATDKLLAQFTNFYKT